MIDAIAAIGDVGDVGCWSGIPYHFWQAARRRGWPAEPVRLPLEQIAWRRRAWNLRQLLRGRGPGGFQYSREFSEWSWRFMPDGRESPHVLSFHPFTPSRSRLQRAGGRFSLYFDATHPLMFARYDLGRSVSRAMAREILAAEREIYRGAERLVFFQRWAAHSAVHECGADPARVAVILPGANLELPPDFRFAETSAAAAGERAFRLGFVGKDWRRKGFPKLLATVERLNRMNLKVSLECIGLIPDEARSHPHVRYHGFLDKRVALDRIVAVMSGCDLGCLFSEVEASSISVLEFLRVGVPVVSSVVDGMADLIPPDAGIGIQPGESADLLAEKIAALLRDESRLANLRASARRWSDRVTWDRCLAEWEELLRHGRISRPVQPWRGLAAAGETPSPISRENIAASTV